MITREEAKELLPIIQAFAEGKTIQYLINCRWEDVDDDTKVYFTDPPSCYRIKPEPKCRPFKSQEECWQEMHKHPDFGWVKRVNDTAYICLNNINKIGRVDGCTFEDIFDKITFTDGTPFGIKEEE